MSDADILLFKEWLLVNGAKFPKIDWPSNETTDEVMVEIPKRLMISPLHAYDDSEIGRLLRENKDILHGDLLLAVYLMFEINKGDSSFYAPFIKILPPPGSISKWDEKNLILLQDEKLISRAKYKKLFIENAYSKHILELCDRRPDIFPLEKYPLELFQFVWHCIQSRAFGRRLPWTSLVPMADCLNHGNVATKYDYNVDDNGMFRLFPSNTNRYSQGSEVFNSYGRRANDNLLLDYGFCLMDNMWDEVLVTVRVPVTPPSASASASPSPASTSATPGSLSSQSTERTVNLEVPRPQITEAAPVPVDQLTACHISDPVRFPESEAQAREPSLAVPIDTIGKNPTSSCNEPVCPSTSTDISPAATATTTTTTTTTTATTATTTATNNGATNNEATYNEAVVSSHFEESLAMVPPVVPVPVPAAVPPIPVSRSKSFTLPLSLLQPLPLEAIQICREIILTGKQGTTRKLPGHLAFKTNPNMKSVSTTASSPTPPTVETETRAIELLLSALCLYQDALPSTLAEDEDLYSTITITNASIASTTTSAINQLIPPQPPLTENQVDFNSINNDDFNNTNKCEKNVTETTYNNNNKNIDNSDNSDILTSCLVYRITRKRIISKNIEVLEAFLDCLTALPEKYKSQWQQQQEVMQCKESCPDAIKTRAESESSGGIGMDADAVADDVLLFLHWLANENNELAFPLNDNNDNTTTTTVSNDSDEGDGNLIRCLSTERRREAISAFESISRGWKQSYSGNDVSVCFTYLHSLFNPQKETLSDRTTQSDISTL